MNRPRHISLELNIILLQLPMPICLNLLHKNNFGLAELVPALHFAEPFSDWTPGLHVI